MGKKREQELTLPSLDELFSSQKTRDDAQTRKIINLPVNEIDDFPNHPFQIKEDEDMVLLFKSIKEYGIITPALVRETETGRYQMISGHRRKYILECLGIEEMPCEYVIEIREGSPFKRQSK